MLTFVAALPLASIVWGAYALAIQDSFIMTQNVVSFVLAVSSLVLLRALPGNKSVDAAHVVRVTEPADLEATSLLTDTAGAQSDASDGTV